MMYNLGNFGGQLQLDDINGALRNTGSSFQFDPQQVQGGMQAPQAPTGAMPPPSWEKPEEEKESAGLGSILGLVGQFMGGTYGAAMQGAGGLMGGGKK